MFNSSNSPYFLTPAFLATPPICFLSTRDFSFFTRGRTASPPPWSHRFSSTTTAAGPLRPQDEWRCSVSTRRRSCSEAEHRSKAARRRRARGSQAEAAVSRARGSQVEAAVQRPIIPIQRSMAKAPRRSMPCP
jgi:hypothetical protein